MGLVFVPVTLTAVHHLRNEDSGIGSGVLNTMQQVGGALGLATLSTVATHVFTTRGAELQKAGEAAAAAAGANAPALTPDQIATMKMVTQQQVFTEGSTTAFLVGALLMLGASAVVWIFLNVKHQELATDGPEGVHVG
jgi:hypothetical protein